MIIKKIMLKKMQVIKLILLLLLFDRSVTKIPAQIVPDDTLETESSRIDSINELRGRIEGGAIRGENLFHSFEEFNIPEGFEIYFANPEQVSNIFSRVTGNNISEIFGTLGVEGTANLFLINPNGIVFGENAAIDIGGSFIATTADSVNFKDGYIWKIRDRDFKPLMTSNIPIGLSLEDGAGEIIVKNSGHTLEDDFGGSFTQQITDRGLETLPGLTIALFAKKVNFEGGILTSSSGKIEIAGIERGIIGFDFSENNDNWNFNYEEVKEFGDINFATRSLIDVSSVPANPLLSGGAIKIHGRNVLLKDGSVLLNKNFGINSSGAIEINATESIKISGTDPIAGVQGGIRTENLQRGDGGDIIISTPDFVAFDGASVATISYSPFPETSSGDIVFNTSKMQILDASPISAFSVSNVATFTFGSGKAGDVIINSGILTIKDGGGLGSSGFFGSVGKISVTATDYIEIEGFQPLVFIGSGIASINAFSTDSGNITVTTPKLYIRNGGSITTSTFGQGNAGDISIDAKNILITGKIPNSKEFDFETSSNISSSTSTVNNILFSQLPLLDFIDTISLEGDAGNITINTDSFTISDSASINVQNVGAGDAGTIRINTNFLNMEAKGEITAASLSGKGGEIEINSDRITLQNSEIAAFAQGEGDGGNIIINSDTVLGINSDIRATAIEGDGGSISIDAEGVLGFTEATAITDNNIGEIDASSQFGQDGTVTITNPLSSNSDPLIFIREFQPRNNTISLSYDCNKGNEALVTDGRSTSFSDAPDESLDTVEYYPEETAEQEEIVEELTWQKNEPYVRANELVLTEDGRVLLVNKSQLKEFVDTSNCSNINEATDR